MCSCPYGPQGSEDRPIEVEGTWLFSASDSRLNTQEFECPKPLSDEPSIYLELQLAPKVRHSHKHKPVCVSLCVLGC